MLGALTKFPEMLAGLRQVSIDVEKMKSILMRTGYSLDVTPGQRKYGGPPPGWDGNKPGYGCEVSLLIGSR